MERRRLGAGRRVALLGGAAALVLLLDAVTGTRSVAQQPSPPPGVPVRVAPARQAEFAPLLWAPGTVVSREDARVAGEQDGRVTLVAEVGTQVRRGEVLARIDDAALRLQERQNLSDIERIDAQLDYARAQEARLEQLMRQHSISGAQHEEARSQRRVLEQELQRARVALEQTRLRLRNASVRAPFDGTVAERYIQVGEYLSVGAPVLRLVNTQALEVRAQAPVNLAARLQPGMRLQLRDGEAGSEQELRAVVPVGDESSRQSELRVALEPGRWPIGAALQLGVPSAEPRAVVAVPRDALLLRASETYVVKVDADGVAQRIAVRTGGVQGELVEVQGDVAPGDRLVVRGGERLAPGQRVRIETAAGAAGVVAAGAP